ncbi:MAG: hypothetical protein AAB728_04720 [Patescibacteria group bacterium]
MSRWLLPPILLLLLSASFVEAQSVGTDTGSGSAVDPWLAERQARADDLRPRMAFDAKRDAARAEQHAAYLAKRTEHRIACRADLRQANRDTKLPTLLRCYRGELSMEREELRKEREYIALLAGISEGIRKGFFAQLDAIREAIQTIMNAIDSDVYEDATQVAVARGKLQRVYRSPFFAARTLLRADRALSWTALLLADLEATGSGVTVNESSRECLSKGEATLRAIQLGTTGSSVLSVTLNDLGACAAQAVVTGSGSSSSAPGTE